MELIYLCQLFGSGLLFFSKLLLTTKNHKASGWWTGIIGVLILTVIVWIFKFWVMFASHFGIVALCIFGLYTLRGQKTKLSDGEKLGVRALIISITVLICGYLYYETYTTRNFNEWQLAHAWTGLIGALFIAFNKRYSNIAGWLVNISSHLCCIHYMSLAGLDTVVFFQKLSILVSIYGIGRELWLIKKPSS